MCIAILVTCFTVPALAQIGGGSLIDSGLQPNQSTPNGSFDHPYSAQCPGGQCPSQRQPQFSPRGPGGIHNPYSRPGQYRNPGAIQQHKKPTGKYASIARFRVQLGEHKAALGSGVLVRWGDKIVVITARHVVVGAKNITVTLTNGETYKGKVLAISSWDCAVVQLDREVVGVEPAELATQAEADAIQEGTLDSCGYGAEGEFAVNSGRFLGYRESPFAEADVSDWIVVSGPARQGDSGGPIFNSNGHVMGILWGTDGQITIGVHVGRLGIVLNEAFKNPSDVVPNDDDNNE